MTEPKSEPRSGRIWVPHSCNCIHSHCSWRNDYRILLLISHSWYLIDGFFSFWWSSTPRWEAGRRLCEFWGERHSFLLSCLIRGHSCQPTSLTSVSRLPDSVSPTLPPFREYRAVCLVDALAGTDCTRAAPPSLRSSSSWVHWALLGHLPERGWLARWTSYDSKHYCLLPNVEEGEVHLKND